MLQLILSTDWVAGRDAIHNMLADDVAQGRPNRILMVPELISHDTERRLCAAAGDTTSRYAEVLSFSRLTRRVSEYTGVVPAECLDNGGRIVAMASVAKQLRGSLKAYASVETKPEFLTDLVDAVDEFKRCCISPNDLRRASLESEGLFAQKLEELSLLYEGYDALTSRGKCDPRDQMTWLLEQLENSTFGENHVIYIDGFPDFTRQHMAIISHLICTSPQVVVCLNCDTPGSNSMAFQKAGETAKTLLSIAKKHGIQVDIRLIEPSKTPVAPVCQKLYQGNIDQVLADNVTAIRVDAPHNEVNIAAEKIWELVRNGVRFRDISVVCGDITQYRTAIHTTFRRSGISYYLSGKECVLEKSVMHTVMTALDAALGGFDQEDVLSYLRSGLSPLSLSDCDKLENYVLLWAITGNAWCAKWENHPRGLGAEWSDRSCLELDGLEQLRERVITPLLRMRDHFKKASNVSQKVEALYAFLEEISFAKRLNQLADEYDRDGDNPSAQVLNQLWSILVNALEQMYDVLGETAWEDNSFARLLRLILGQYDVGTIPPVLDAVTVGPVSAMRCQQAKHLIVLGVAEGDMPGYSGASGVLNDWERTALREMGIPLTGGALEGIYAEFSEIYGVFCGARESITVSCSAGTPSFVFRRLSVFAGGEQTGKEYAAFAGPDRLGIAADLVRDGNEELAQELGLSYEYQHILDSAAFEYGTVSQENIRGLYGDKLTLSASQVDKFAECRMRYFLQYGLRTRERKPATVDPAEYGTYVHAVLEETAREVMAKGGFHNCTVSDVLTIARKHSGEYINSHFADINSQRISYLLNRNVQELDMVVEELWNELHSCAFQPVHFELNFGDGGMMPPITIDGAAMEACLQGFVDRVDVWNEQGRNYIRVVDYKTGKKDFDYCDVFNGIGLQMLLYLFALTRRDTDLLGKCPYPAGVQYFPARAPVVAADGALSKEDANDLRIKEWKRKGLLLHDMDVLQAMQPDGAPQRLDFRIKKDGEVTGAVASREQLSDLEKYITILLRQFVDTIASGDVSANPYTRGSYHNACAFCPYTQICGGEQAEGRRDYAAMKADEFWEQIRKKVNAYG